MSLTIFVNGNRSEVGIVTWFRDPRVNVDYATGPLIRMSLEEFRMKGHALVYSHFEEYSRKKLSESQVVKVFETGEARKLMKDSVAVELSMEPSGQWWIEPKRIAKYSLAELESYGTQTRRALPPAASGPEFWKVLDAALAIAAT